MTEPDQWLDKASKRSALGGLLIAAAATVCLFGPPFFIPLVSLPLWALGVLQRFTERPWLLAAACAWGVGLAAIWSQPAIGLATVIGAGLFGWHWSVMTKAERARKALP